MHIWVCPATLRYQFEVILMLSTKQMQICTGLNSLSPYNNESKSSRNLCYGIFSFIVLLPGHFFKTNIIIFTIWKMSIQYPVAVIRTRDLLNASFVP